MKMTHEPTKMTHVMKDDIVTYKVTKTILSKTSWLETQLDLSFYNICLE